VSSITWTSEGSDGGGPLMVSTPDSARLSLWRRSSFHAERVGGDFQRAAATGPAPSRTTRQRYPRSAAAHRRSPPTLPRRLARRGTGKLSVSSSARTSHWALAPLDVVGPSTLSWRHNDHTSGRGRSWTRAATPSNAERKTIHGRYWDRTSDPCRVKVSQPSLAVLVTARVR
jgi:hypothetical protein